MVKTRGKRILSQKGIVLSQENLERFKIKSEFLIPACFGGFDPNDPVCKDYCFRARPNDLDIASWKVEKSMNETSPSYGGFFHRDFKFQESCQQKREELEAKLKKVSEQITRELEDCDSQRVRRDDSYLSEDSTRMGRIPVGETRDAEDFRNFTESTMLYLETKNTQHYLHPYGPRYDDALGRIYELHPNGCPPFFDSSTDFGFVKSITPKLTDARLYRIKIIHQAENNDRNLVLEAQVNYDENNNKVNGQKLTIEVYGDSAKEDVKVDDVGKL
ncbi:MAG: hypothetical protein AAB577_01690 [Patescibacteria group bacterium]